MMKLHTFSLSLATLLTALVVACRPIPEKDRLIPNEVELSKGRSVLIEDYSGVGCVNCPIAAKAITEAASAHGDKVVIVALHGSNTQIGTRPKEDPKGLYHADAATYLERLQAGGSLPIATFNRRPLASNGGKTFSPMATKWAAEMQAIRELPQLYKLELQVSKQDRKISVQCSASALDLSEELSASLKEHQLYIQLWLVEDRIVAPQHLKKGLDKEYEHNHIFRQALNGIDGESYDLGKTYNHTGTIDRDVIQLEHCAVVAILYDHKTGEVYEVLKKAL